MRVRRTIPLIIGVMLLASCGAIPNGAVSPSPQATTVEANSTRVADGTDPPSPSAAPSADEPALPTDEPSETSVPDATDEPTVTEEPAQTEAPTITEEPATTAEPSPSVTTTSTDVPTEEPSVVVTDTATTSDHVITITDSFTGTAITSPITVTGDANFWPFEGSLAGVVKDADGNVLGVGPLSVESPGAPQGGPFEGVIAFEGPAAEQDGVIEVFEASAKDGTILTIARLPVRLAAATTSGLQLDAPEFGQDVTLPLHIALRVNPPVEQLQARLEWSNGAVLEQPIEVVTGSDGVGYAVANMQWNTEGPPPATEPGAATLQILDADGAVQRELTVNVLPDDQMQPVQVAWRAGDEIITFTQRVPRTQGIGAAALRELLNGVADGNLAGAESALPSVAEIVTSPQREAGWGYRVRLLDLVIENGVATANFSRELRAYGGDAARADQIRQQIERTLTQFPTVQRVVIQIDGENVEAFAP